jgi:hypothetical protein
VPVVFFSIIYLMLFGTGILAYLACLVVWGLLVGRVLVLSGQDNDMRTWKVWVVRTCVLFVLRRFVRV